MIQHQAPADANKCATGSRFLMSGIASAWAEKTLNCGEHRERVSLVIFPKTHQGAKRAVAYAASTTDPHRVRKKPAGRGAADGVLRMVGATTANAVCTRGRAELPCAATCAVYRRRLPTPRRPRPIVSWYRQKWMNYDQYDLVGGSGDYAGGVGKKAGTHRTE